MKKLFLAGAAMLALVSGAHTESLVIPSDVSNGYMNVRSGPGVNYALLAQAPAGTEFTWQGRASCVRRQDGIAGADWCKVNYSGVSGWISRAGLMPVQRVVSNNYNTSYDTPVPMPDERTEYECGRPIVYVGDDVRDRNPVLSINVSYDPSEHGWRVFHNRADGSVVSRSTQYSIVDYSNDNRMRWEGSLNRNRNIYMMAGLKEVNGTLVYSEEIIDRGLGGRLTMRMSTSCQEVTYRKATSPVG